MLHIKRLFAFNTDLSRIFQPKNSCAVFSFPAFSRPAFLCHIFQSRIFSRPLSLRDLQVLCDFNIS